MNTRIYKFSFKTEAHFSEGTLDKSSCTFMADTLYSALCLEALRQGKLDKFHEANKEGQLKFSDAFPFIGERLYLPKPVLQISFSEQKKSITKENIINRKLYKKMKYICLDLFDDYLNGKDIIAKNGFDNLGVSALRTKNAIRNGTAETLPYHVGTFRFEKGNGLYVICAYADDSQANMADELFKGLELSGIGGKRSAGLGRFNLEILKEGKAVESLNKLLSRNLSGEHIYNMSLCVCLPKENELNEAMNSASYCLVKRSGFVAPVSGVTEVLKKKDMYLFAAGSCFKKKFQGDIYNVARGTPYPVYRYAKPLFIEVESHE